MSATIYLRGDDCPTMEVLKEHFTNLGVPVVRHKAEEHDVTVCWGTSMQELRGPNLNGKVNKYSKFTHFKKFDKLDVRHPLVFEREKILDFIDDPPPFPWLGRKPYHDNGKDIIPMTSLKEVVRALINREDFDFVSVFVPTEAEYRVWVFGSKVLAVYKKVHKGKRFTGIERQFDFYRSFLFQNRDDLLNDKRLCKLSTDAVASIDLDFGAVDVLLGEDHKYYVLEVNSMPNIDCLTRVSGIRLTKAIAKWADENGG